MRNKIIGLLLLALQLYFVVLGRNLFDKYWNAILFFIISIIIPIYLFRLRLSINQSNSSLPSTKRINEWVWGFIGVLSIAFTYEEIRKNFIYFRDFGKVSDVIPQAQTLFNRFANGQFPYSPIPFETYSLEPIYFPFHWLPIIFSKVWPIDIRWAGWGILVLIAGVYGWKIKSLSSQKINLALALICPSLVLWAFTLWAKGELSVTYEIVIGAYYLLLGAGLVSKNYWLIGIGIVCCLLSRFTLIFWLPFFAFLLWKDVGIKMSILFWVSVFIALLVFFFVPFYFKDPQFIVRGMTHYMNATIGDWIGSGDPPVSWTQENGISFAPIFRALLPGDMVYKVHITQVIQAILLMFTLIASFIAYKKWNHKIPIHYFMFISLYNFLLIYYFFAPLTYRYYLFSFLILSAVLCGMIILTLSKTDIDLEKISF